MKAPCVYGEIAISYVDSKFNLNVTSRSDYLSYADSSRYPDMASFDCAYYHHFSDLLSAARILNKEGRDFNLNLCIGPNGEYASKYVFPYSCNLIRTGDYLELTVMDDRHVEKDGLGQFVRFGADQKSVEKAIHFAYGGFLNAQMEYQPDELIILSDEDRNGPLKQYQDAQGLHLEDVFKAEREKPVIHTVEAIMSMMEMEQLEQMMKMTGSELEVRYGLKEDDFVTYNITFPQCSDQTILSLNLVSRGPDEPPFIGAVLFDQGTELARVTSEDLFRTGFSIQADNEIYKATIYTPKNVELMQNEYGNAPSGIQIISDPTVAMPERWLQEVQEKVSQKMHDYGLGTEFSSSFVLEGVIDHMTWGPTKNTLSKEDLKQLLETCVHSAQTMGKTNSLSTLIQKAEHVKGEQQPPDLCSIRQPGKEPCI